MGKKVKITVNGIPLTDPKFKLKLKKKRKPDFSKTISIPPIDKDNK